MGDAFIRLSGVSKVYRLGDVEIQALRDVDLEISQAEFLALYGPSGSGKTTLCNLIGLIDESTTGEVRFGDTPVHDLSDDERSDFRSSRIGFIFQSFNLMPVLSALENVMLPLLIAGTARPDASDRAAEILTELGLGKHLGHRPQKLSGGQQQRVAIARALITDPQLVVADEPTANLDSVTAGEIIDAMRSSNAAHGTTFVFSTHDERLLSRVDRRVRLEDGVLSQEESR